VTVGAIKLNMKPKLDAYFVCAGADVIQNVMKFRCAAQGDASVG